MISKVILQCIDKEDNLIENGKKELFQHILKLELVKNGHQIDELHIVFGSKHGHELISEHFQDILMIQLGVSFKETPDDEDNFKYIFKGILSNQSLSGKNIVLTYVGGQKILDTNPPASSAYNAPIKINELLQNNIAVLEEFTHRDLALEANLGADFNETQIIRYNYSNKSLLKFIYETSSNYGFLFTVNYQNSLTNYSLINPFSRDLSVEHSLDLGQYYPDYLEYSINYLELNGQIESITEKREKKELKPSTSFSGDATEDDDTPYKIDYANDLGYYKVEYLNNFSQASVDTDDQLHALYNRNRLNNCRIKFVSDIVLEIGHVVEFTLKEETSKIDTLAKSLLGKYCITDIELSYVKNSHFNISYSAVKI